MIVAEKAEEKRCELVLDEPALETSQWEGARQASLGSLDPKDWPELDQ